MLIVGVLVVFKQQIIQYVTILVGLYLFLRPKGGIPGNNSLHNVEVFKIINAFRNKKVE